MDISLQTQDPSSLKALADGKWQSGNYQESLNLYKQIVQQTPFSVPNLLALCKATGNFYYDRDLMTSLLSLAQNDANANANANANDAITYFCRASIGVIDTNEILSIATQRIDSSSACRSLLVLYQSLLVLLGQAAPSTLPKQNLSAYEFAEIQSLMIAYQARSQARIVGLPAELLRFAMRVAPSQGIFVECGVYHGKSIGILAEQKERRVVGFDSFQGLPEDWKAGEKAGSYSTQGRKPKVPENVELIEGWFKDTLPLFVEHNAGQFISLLHIDCDLYSSAYEALILLSPVLMPGTIIVFDDMLAYPGWEQHEWRALQDFASQTGRSYRFVGFVFMGREVAIEITR